MTLHHQQSAWWDYCQVCKRKVPRATLAYREFTWKAPAGQNRLTYSEYVEAGGWSGSRHAGVGTAFLGNLDHGMYPDERWSIFTDPAVPRDPYTSTVRNGAPRFEHQGTIVSPSFDPTGWNSVTCAMYVGPTDTSAAAPAAWYIGLTDGLATSLLKTYARLGTSRQLWFTAQVTSLVVTFPCSFYIATDFTDTWWAENAQVERDVSVPGNFIPTSGAAVVRTAPVLEKGMLKACPRCHEIVHNDPRLFPPEAHVEDQAIPGSDL